LVQIIHKVNQNVFVVYVYTIEVYCLKHISCYTHELKEMSVKNLPKDKKGFVL